MDQNLIIEDKLKPKRIKRPQDAGREEEEKKTVRLKDYAKHIFDKSYEQNIERRV